MLSKECKHCKENKSLDKFHANKKGKFGVHSVCKVCKNKRDAERLGNDKASEGTFVDHFTITPNATVANSTAAIKGHATVGHDLTVSGDLAVTGSYGLGSSDIPNNAADTSGTATNAEHVKITDNESTSENNQIVFIENWHKIKTGNRKEKI